MATCKDCFHYDVCHTRQKGISLDPMKCGYKCPDFKNKSAFQEVKHGQWENNLYCSACGYVYDTGEYKNSHNYCPNCGALMDGGNYD